VAGNQLLRERNELQPRLDAARCASVPDAVEHRGGQSSGLLSEQSALIPKFCAVLAR
jgi:hypothetical protein